jgi:hypothetical protein
MSERQVQGGRIGRGDEELAVRGDGLLVLPHSGVCDCVQRQVLLVVGVASQECVELPSRSRIHLSINQYANVIQPGGVVVRCESQDGFQQVLRLVQDVALLIDPCQQPQRFDVVARPLQLRSDDVFRGRRVSIREQATGLNDLRRQLCQGCNMPGGYCRIAGVARHAIQAFEHAPALRQRRIEAHATLEGFDCPACVSPGYKTIAAFLRARRLYRASGLAAQLWGLVHLAGLRHPRVESRRLEQDGLPH